MICCRYDAAIVLRRARDTCPVGRHAKSRNMSSFSSKSHILLVLYIFFRHYDVSKWKYYPPYWSFVQGIHRSPENSPHKGQWRGALMFSLICVWTNDWENTRNAGDLRRHRVHYDVIVMFVICKIVWLDGARSRDIDCSQAFSTFLPWIAKENNWTSTSRDRIFTYCYTIKTPPYVQNLEGMFPEILQI